MCELLGNLDLLSNYVVMTERLVVTMLALKSVTEDLSLEIKLEVFQNSDANMP